MAAPDYIDLATVKARLGLDAASGDSGDKDGMLAQYISMASRWVDRKTKRAPGEFAAATQTRVYDVDPSVLGVLSLLPPRPYAETSPAGEVVPLTSAMTLDIDAVTSVTTFATDGDGDGTYETVWAATDFDLLPLNAPLRGLPYRQVRVNQFGSFRLPVGPKRVQLTGTFGESDDVPDVIRDATFLLLSRAFARRKNAYAVEGASMQGVTLRIPATDPDVEALLCEAGYIDFWHFA